jgi:arylformamidase
VNRIFFDVSVGLTPEMPVWPGDPGFEITVERSVDQEEESTVSRLTMGTHVGTHVDAPAHFIQDAPSVDALPLNVLIGPAVVLELDSAKYITVSDLEGLELRGKERVLFKTRNSALWAKNEFTADYVSIEPEAARYLFGQGAKLVGIDYLSISDFDDAMPTHRMFLERGIVVVEGLDLSGVSPGEYEMICLPLKAMGADGSPARVVLRADGG